MNDDSLITTFRRRESQMEEWLLIIIKTIVNSTRKCAMVLRLTDSLRCISVFGGLAKTYLVNFCQRNFHKFPVLRKSKPQWGINKKHREVKLFFSLNIMADPKVEKILAPLRAAVKEQGDLVRKLKDEKASEIDIKKQVAELKLRKKKLDEKEMELTPASAYFDRAKMEDLLKRRFFYDQSFSIYGGVTGQYDFGPMGCAIKTNILNEWRSFFVQEEQMFEVDCSILTPERVLKASGHVDRFADLMVKDIVNGECFRLDHLIKSHLEKLCVEKGTSEDKKRECETLISKLDSFSKDELQEILIKYDVKSPLTGNKLSEPIEFNLMFGTQIGPVANIKGYLRPETAQGIFVNFKRLLEFNQGKLPFAAAQIGNAFRNEISPRSGLLRVREFTMAEIEHFCDPADKSHEKFSSVANVKLTLYSACNQMDGKSAEKLTIGEAITSGMVANETLGYFMARIFLFLLNIGIDEEKLRFRQHMSNEMAHYACDCWDAECLTSYGWIECVGCADRSAYDLTQHFKVTGVRLAAEKRLPEPRIERVTKVFPQKSVLGKIFKTEMKSICDQLNSLSISDVLDLQKHLNEKGEYTLTVNGSQFKLTKEMIDVKSVEEKIHVEEIIPNVIEPSFGIGRIMYSLFEHSFHVRQGKGEGDGKGEETRTYFSLSPNVAPIKCAVLPLSSNDKFVPFIKQISSDLRKEAVSYKIDDSAGSIGKRYTRSDEIAIPFAITVDFDSLEEPHTVTLRERDTTEQLRIPITDISVVVRKLTNCTSTWNDFFSKYPKFEQQESTKSL